MSFVLPETYHVGYTVLNMPEMERYLRDSGNEDFLRSIADARKLGLSDGEILTSFYAKVCYASLTEGKNLNVDRIRDVPENLKATINQGHGSVWEHCKLNFITRNCSRVYTHEQVRHRVGVAYSQTSGRYVRSDRLDMILDPILAKHGVLTADEAERLREYLEAWMLLMGQRIAEKGGKDFNLKKKLTSAARRFLPNGQANEMGFSMNLRSIRHVVQVRTGRHAEWEIRMIYGQVYQLLKYKFPMLFWDAKEEVVDGLVEVSGMKMQPYEK